MDQIAEFFKGLLHLDQTIGELIRTHGPLTYGILFAIVFAETGLVIMPFLPGDTLLFAAGMFSHGGKEGLNIWIVLGVLTLAPICGDNVNYAAGKWLGPKIFRHEKSRFLNRNHLERTHQFFDRYGAKTIMLARWVPIVRTFAPFVAGMSGMPYRKFILYSVIGAVIWVWGCTGAGYLFGQIPVVRNNFELAMLGLVAVTVAPIVYETIKHRREAAAALRTEEPPADPQEHETSPDQH